MKYRLQVGKNKVADFYEFKEIDQLIATKEQIITAGTTAQYRRGDNTWQTLNKTVVGLANVDNTTDALKPISTATQTALNGKAPSGFGLGEAGVTVTDCNNATTSGIFYSPPSDPNRPSGATDGMVLVMAYASNYVIQIHSSWNTGFTYRRHKNVTWSAWVKMATV